MPTAFTNKQDQSHKFCLELGRLESFDDNWPHAEDSLCSRTNMAKAGFFYYGIKDQVKCFVCSLKLDHWKADEDDPWTKHKELANDCAFAKFGKEEDLLTVEQWCDVNKSRIINILNGKFNKIQEDLIL